MADETTQDGAASANAAAGFASGATFLGGLLGSFYSASQYRSELAIRKEEREINRILAESAFDRNMESLLNAQNDMTEQITQQTEDGRKQFKSQQATLQVMAAERGMDGQSLTDVHNDLTKSHENFKQLQRLGLHKMQRDVLLKREGLIDARTAEIASQLSLPSAPNSFAFLVSAFPDTAIDAITIYEKYRSGGTGYKLGEKD